MHYYRAKFDIQEKPTLPGIDLSVEEFWDVWSPLASDPSLPTEALFQILEGSVTYWYDCLTARRPWGVIFFSLLPTIESDNPMVELADWIKHHDVKHELRWLWLKSLRRKHAKQGRAQIKKEMVYRISRMYVYMLGHAIRDWHGKYKKRKRETLLLPSTGYTLDTQTMEVTDMYLDNDYDWYTTYALNVAFTDQEQVLAISSEAMEAYRRTLNDYKERTDREWNSI